MQYATKIFQRRTEKDGHYVKDLSTFWTCVHVLVDTTCKERTKIPQHYFDDTHPIQFLCEHFTLVNLTKQFFYYSAVFWKLHNLNKYM